MAEIQRDEVKAESELDRAERRLMETCHKIDAQLKATIAEIRLATETVRKLKEAFQMNTAQLISVDDAIDFLRSQGFQINLVDGIYRVRKEGWGKRPYELDAETLIKQANLIKNMAH